MKEFFVIYQDKIMTATISFVVAILTSLLTHFLGNFKLLYTEKLKIASDLSKIKYEGITEIRKEIDILSQYEDLCITEDNDILIFENIGEKVYTPACCYSYKSLTEIASVLNELHRKYGYCLRNTSVIYI